MQYNKSATTIDQQIALLKRRGMVCANEELVRRWLVTVGYYRLSAYWLPFEVPHPSDRTRSKQFAPKTMFEDIVDVYTFDRKLRLLVTEAIERVEIALRSSWTHRMSLDGGPHIHLNDAAFDCGWMHAKRISAMADRVGQSREVFITHFRDKYTGPYMPPLWAVTELMTLGELSKWVSATSNRRIGSAVAKDLGLPTRETLEGVIQAIAYVRNMCAHHARLWNRRFVKRTPNIKRFRKDLAIDIVGDQAQPQNYIYNVLVVLARLIVHQSPDTTLPDRIATLASSRSSDQLSAMVFPDDWVSRPIWNLKGD
ncbi:MAG: Abi family protein [Henriciella sp.]